MVAGKKICNWLNSHVNSLQFGRCYSTLVTEHIFVFSPKHSNVLYSLKLELLKTESKLKPFLIKRLKIIARHLDGLNYIFNVLLLISIIVMKYYLFSTIFQLSAPKLYSLVLLLTGNIPLYLSLCAGAVLL